MSETLIARIISEMTPGAYGIWALVVLALLGWFKIRPQLAEIKSNSDTSLRSDLMARIVKLETQQEALTVKHDTEMEKERLRCDRDMAILRAEIAKLRRHISALEVVIARAHPEGTPPDMQAQLDAIRREGDIQ